MQTPLTDVERQKILDRLNSIKLLAVQAEREIAKQHNIPASPDFEDFVDLVSLIKEDADAIIETPALFD